MNIEKPTWVDGDSLLREPEPARPIFSVATGSTNIDSETGEFVRANLGPPFFQFGRVTVIVCSKWRQLDLTTRTWDEGYLIPKDNYCGERSEFTEAEALDLVINHLKDSDFDTISLESLRK